MTKVSSGDLTFIRYVLCAGRRPCYTDPMPKRAQQDLFSSADGNRPASAQAADGRGKPKAPRKKKAETVPAPVADEGVGKPEPVFSVGEFLDYVNELFRAREYAVVGEITECNPHPSGLYFTLKDKEGEGVMNCYMNPYAYRMLGVQLEAGMLVKATGAPSVYKPKGRFSFVARHVEPFGEGSLRQAYELLKKKLEAEGLFTRKRELPEFIGKVGIITSRTGAVIGDFRKNLKPLGLALSLADVRVEGASAPGQIIRAFERFNTAMADLDVIVLIRGGGSLEDMQPFNNELVARAVFGSRVPVIAGLGHDRDVPIAALVADRMTSTPSFAAQMVNDSWSRLFEGLPRLENGVFDAYGSALAETDHKLTTAAAHLAGFFRNISTRYERYAERVVEFFKKLIEQTNERVRYAERVLAVMSPERNLKLGYSILFDAEGGVLRSAEGIRKGSRIKARLAKGSLKATVDEAELE